MLLMTFATRSVSSVSGGFTRAMIQGFAGVKAVIRAINHRRDVLRLTELDERGLKDIGLMRSDVEGALATSWLNDPSLVLASRSSTGASVAAARREEGLRQAHVTGKDSSPGAGSAALPAPSSARRLSPTPVACSA